MPQFEKGQSGNPQGKKLGTKNKVYKKNLADIAKMCREADNSGVSFDAVIVQEYKDFLKKSLNSKKLSPHVKNKILQDYFDRVHGKATQKIEQETTFLNKDVAISIVNEIEISEIENETNK